MISLLVFIGRDSSVVTDVLLPLKLAALGIAGTIAVTVIQLKARRRELDDDRAERDVAEVGRRRDEIFMAVLESIGPFAATTSAVAEHRRQANLTVMTVNARVAALIRLNGGLDAQYLTFWWGKRSLQFGSALAPHAGPIENAIVWEVTGWHNGTLSAHQIAVWSQTDPTPRAAPGGRSG